MKILRAAVFAALPICGPLFGQSPEVVTPEVAPDVTLRARDAAIELSGRLLGFDGEFYRIETRYGELTLDSTGVTCEGVGCPSLIDYVAEITISGSATIGQVLMPALLESFALRNGLRATRTTHDEQHFGYTLTGLRDHKKVAEFSFHVTNTDEGFADLLANRADIVMALREIRKSEIELAKEAGLGKLDHPNRSRVLALDAMVPIVAPANPVQMISVSDLARVLSGDLNNWRALGGVDAPITVHLRDTASGLSQGLEDRVLAPANAQLGAQVVRHKSNADLARAVVRDPFGIGVASFSETGNSRALIIAGSCDFTLSAARRSIKTEDYPLTAPMFLYLPARRLPKLARDFLTFMRSPPAQITIRRAGFVDQAPEEISVDLQGYRFANAIQVAQGEAGLKALRDMTQSLRDMRRLSTSFRFEPGSTRLDAQSRSNVQQLARALETGAYDGRKLVFVGFSDGQGPAEGNLAIARKRAKAVRDAVEAAAETADLDRITIETEAYGEAMPMACDDTSWGRQVNRRVEVWLQ
ncbi:MAG: phosphate ABC transporter substrate-binding/OmpA family protein [Pelagimonas sp.]|jgi:phosphate transport system substrate-binding protein|nr:phosphate ABC transporter substrate-binding/OmpA family protein [Pelagimonas sp.]